MSVNILKAHLPRSFIIEHRDLASQTVYLVLACTSAESHSNSKYGRGCGDSRQWCKRRSQEHCSVALPGKDSIIKPVRLFQGSIIGQLEQNRPEECLWSWKGYGICFPKNFYVFQCWSCWWCLIVEIQWERKRGGHLKHETMNATGNN